jgi:hypothetical protein
LRNTSAISARIVSSFAGISSTPLANANIQATEGASWRQPERLAGRDHGARVEMHCPTERIGEYGGYGVFRLA